MAAVALRDVHKGFGDVEVIKGVTLDIADREFVVFVGPSGCGKSTLLRLIAGLEEITSGDVLIDGERVNDVAPARRGLAMVFQSYALYPHMTVADNMAFALRLAGESREERARKVQEAARVLQLEPLLARKPKELSGGQRQRVAIGRAIVRNPRVFLFDEPLSNLDAALRVQMRVELTRLHDQLQATMIYVTHDQVEAMTMADKIVVLQAGVVEQVGSPLELYHHPRNLFVAGFIGSPKMNFLRASVSDVNLDVATVKLRDGTRVEVSVEPDHLQEGEEVTLGVRPEHLTIVADGPLHGEVLVVERLGGTTFLHVKLEGGELITVEADGENAVRMHDRVDLGLGRDRCHLFDAGGLAIPRATRHPLAEDLAGRPGVRATAQDVGPRPLGDGGAPGMHR
ncbi:ABC transporter ATP-binding protein [Anaeromyxobacter oryzae]|uniref:Sugar ABC transporter ATP-binding protein n=1 Tax=Anaeromyxobacter oryzae TaxID=2918170 RepID=A0ABM7WQ91_9BACT|nr:sn-glycerol-3-phosphate ABC transporter ATP-binding protein UgpC [Anaeromyxobacter oryzae]BDG01631.1 sugar ABC transporter ATP-binding protein [Anaeromyxobacter oryzae]